MITPEQEKDLLHQLSILEHEQWMLWAQNLMENEVLSDELRHRWEGYLKPYNELDIHTQKRDTFFAKKSLDIFKSFLQK